MTNKQEYFQRPEIIENDGLTRSPELRLGLSNGGEMPESSADFGQSFLKSVPVKYRPANSSPGINNIENAISW